MSEQKGLPPMRPTGWFQVAWSADITIGEVKSLHYFGTDLVAFRREDGTVAVLDAHCQHLGAHLGGGCVVGNDIQCPFHGWVWNGEGRNVSIPYQDRPNKARRIRSWPVAEQDEGIFVWHDPNGGPPRWELPNVREQLGAHIAERKFAPVGPDERSLKAGIRVHPQVIAENAVDPHHFRFVHQTPISPTVLHEETDGARWQAKVGFGRRWSDGVDRPDDHDNTIQIMWSGIGTSWNGELLGRGDDAAARIIAICTTPVDDQYSDIFATYWIEDGAKDHAERLAQAKAALDQDISIWHTQIYLEPPGLATSEAAGFRRLRRWANSFYDVAG